MEKVLYLEQGEKYSDKQEGYFMVPNWLFDEGEHIELDVYERMALIYIIRCVNKKDNSKGKGDIFFLSADNLSRKCKFSLGKAKKVLKKLQDYGYIGAQPRQIIIKPIRCYTANYFGKIS